MGCPAFVFCDNASIFHKRNEALRIHTLAQHEVIKESMWKSQGRATRSHILKHKCYARNRIYFTPCDVITLSRVR